MDGTSLDKSFLNIDMPMLVWVLLKKKETTEKEYRRFDTWRDMSLPFPGSLPLRC